VIHKSKGIVFRYTKYGETSIIVTIFTDLFGLQSYIVNGVRSKSAKNKIALYQPLTLLNLVAYHRENANLERIKEIQCFHPYATMTSDIRKSTVALFINELLNRTVKDESHAQELFEFLSTSLITFDSLPSGFENFHLMFMLKLSRFLGFGAQNVNQVLGPRIIDEDSERFLLALLQKDYTAALQITNEQRRNLLDVILKFYADHIDSMGEIRSVQILKEVLS
jgi:DNA repair protein RecO (recombination protein O)